MLSDHTYNSILRFLEAGKRLRSPNLITFHSLKNIIPHHHGEGTNTFANTKNSFWTSIVKVILNLFNKKKSVNKILEALFWLSLHIIYLISHLQLCSAVCCSKLNTLHTAPLACRCFNYSWQARLCWKEFQFREELG